MSFRKEYENLAPQNLKGTAVQVQVVVVFGSWDWFVFTPRRKVKMLHHNSQSNPESCAVNWQSIPIH